MTDTDVTFLSCCNIIGHTRMYVMTLTFPPSLPLSRLYKGPGQGWVCDDLKRAELTGELSLVFDHLGNTPKQGIKTYQKFPIWYFWFLFDTFGSHLILLFPIWYLWIFFDTCWRCFHTLQLFSIWYFWFIFDTFVSHLILMNIFWYFLKMFVSFHTCNFFYLQLKELDIFSDAPCDTSRCSVFILPHGMAVTGTDCNHIPGIGRTFTGSYPCCMLELPIPGHTQVLACAPRLWGEVTVGGLRITIVRARPSTASFSHCLSHQD